MARAKGAPKKKWPFPPRNRYHIGPNRYHVGPNRYHLRIWTKRLSVGRRAPLAPSAPVRHSRPGGRLRRSENRQLLFICYHMQMNSS